MRRTLPIAIWLVATLVACDTSAERAIDSTLGTRVAARQPVVRDSAPAAPVLVAIESPDIDVDPCSAGMIKGDSVARMVAVRSGPGAEYPAVDSIPAGLVYSMCDGASEWTGIVYRHQGDLGGDVGGCGVSSPVAGKREYRGPCRSGWIPAEANEVVAG